MIAEEKKELRRVLIKKRNSIEEKVRKEKDGEIAKRVISLADYENAETIFAYANFKSEVSTDLIIADALSKGKTVALPKVIGKKIDFFAVSGKEYLEESRLGIPEPITGCPMIEKFDFLIMPCVGFDEEKNRLGYGGGYYDRFLQGYKEKYGSLPKVCQVAFEVQGVCDLPCEKNDVKADIIITEGRII